MADQGPFTEGRILTSRGPIAREVVFLVYATVVLYVVLAAVIAGGAIVLLRNQAVNHRLARNGQQAHQFVCTLRANLVHVQMKARADLVLTRTLLKSNPSLFGLTPAQWKKALADSQDQIDNRQETIDAGQMLRCES